MQSKDTSLGCICSGKSWLHFSKNKVTSKVTLQSCKHIYKHIRYFCITHTDLQSSGRKKLTHSLKDIKFPNQIQMLNSLTTKIVKKHECCMKGQPEVFQLTVQKHPEKVSPTASITVLSTHFIAAQLELCLEFTCVPAHPSLLYHLQQT